MDKIILLVMQGLILLLAIMIYHNANKMLKDKKDEFKRISGVDYDTHMKLKKELDKIKK